MNQTSDEQLDSIWNHLSELRTVLLRCLSVIAVALIGVLFFHQNIFDFAVGPFKQLTTSPALIRTDIRYERISNPSQQAQQFVLPPGAKLLASDAPLQHPESLFIPPGASIDLEILRPSSQLAILGPIDGIISSLKICLWVSLVISAPVWLYFVLLFILPGLHAPEKKLLGPFIGLSFCALLGGAAFGYYVTLPLSNAFLWSFNDELGLNLWSLSAYLDYTLFLLLANALAFEISLVLFFLVHLRVISAQNMKNSRRHMLVAVLILGALLTPPDIPSQLLVAIPLALLYEIAILYAKFLQRQA